MYAIIDVMQKFAASTFMGKEETSFGTKLITTYVTMDTWFDTQKFMSLPPTKSKHCSFSQ
jgi:hypothetical protein